MKEFIDYAKLQQTSQLLDKIQKKIQLICNTSYIAGSNTKQDYKKLLFSQQKQKPFFQNISIKKQDLKSQQKNEPLQSHKLDRYDSKKFLVLKLQQENAQLKLENNRLKRLFQIEKKKSLRIKDLENENVRLFIKNQELRNRCNNAFSQKQSSFQLLQSLMKQKTQFNYFPVDSNQKIKK